MRPAVLGATLPGSPGANKAFIPNLLAESKSVPPGGEAKSIITASEETEFK